MSSGQDYSRVDMDRHELIDQILVSAALVKKLKPGDVRAVIPGSHQSRPTRRSRAMRQVRTTRPSSRTSLSCALGPDRRSLDRSRTLRLGAPRGRVGHEVPGTDSIEAWHRLSDIPSEPLTKE
jgi:hypothetical protein